MSWNNKIVKMREIELESKKPRGLEWTVSVFSAPEDVTSLNITLVE